MATSKGSFKFRSITYPNSEKGQQNHSANSRKSRGMLKRMDSIDLEQGLTQVGQLHHQYSHSPNRLQTPFQHQHSSGIKMGKHRDLSLEGHLRAQHFQKTHSASSALGHSQRMLRFSDGSLGKPGSSSSSQTLNHNVRSTSCLPLSKHRSSPSPKASNTNLERLVDWQRSSQERTSFSPSRSLERPDHSSSEGPTSVNCQATAKPQRSSRNTHERKLERFYSTDHQHDEKGSKQVTINSATGGGALSAQDSKSRRSQFRRAISLFSLSCDKETEREKREKTPQRILRPPTRHVYRRGVSGLPIECNSRSLGIVY